jgi:hypothetical protein
MSKLWRFVKHLWGCCFVVVEKGYFRIIKWTGLIATILLAIVPWMLGFISALSKYVWISWLGIALLILRAFWHSFAMYDELKEKTKPRVRVTAGEPYRNKNGNNTVYSLNVQSLSSGDIEECSATLTEITHDRKLMWGHRRTLLTFQPAERRSDTISKTIRQGTTEHLDVLFLFWNGSKNLPVKPAVYEPWIFSETPEEIFCELGDYILTVEITAKAMPTVTAKLKFRYANMASALEVLAAR